MIYIFLESAENFWSSEPILETIFLSSKGCQEEEKTILPLKAITIWHICMQDLDLFTKHEQTFSYLQHHLMSYSSNKNLIQSIWVWLSWCWDFFSNSNVYFCIWGQTWSLNIHQCQAKGKLLFKIDMLNIIGVLF